MATISETFSDTANWFRSSYRNHTQQAQERRSFVEIESKSKRKKSEASRRVVGSSISFSCMKSMVKKCIWCEALPIRFFLSLAGFEMESEELSLAVHY